MPYIGSNVGNKTTFDSVRQGNETVMRARQQKMQNPVIAPKFTQRITGENAAQTRQGTAQRMQNPIIPKRTTQEINTERNNAAAERRARIRAAIDESKHGG